MRKNMPPQVASLNYFLNMVFTSRIFGPWLECFLGVQGDLTDTLGDT